MNMIEINLLPDRPEKKGSRFGKIDLSGLKLSKVPVLKAAAAVAAVLAVLHAALFFIGIFSASKFNLVSRKYGEILPAKLEADALKARRDDMNKRVSAIDELMVKRYIWSRKLNSLSGSVTPGIWLAEIDYNETLVERPQAGGIASGVKEKPCPVPDAPEMAVLRYLTISGYASSMGEQGTALVGKFMKNLEDNSGFSSDISKIELKSIASERISDQEVMSFKVSCLLKEMK